MRLGVLDVVPKVSEISMLSAHAIYAHAHKLNYIACPAVNPTDQDYYSVLVLSIHSKRSGLRDPKYGPAAKKAKRSCKWQP